jgi:hypothetical protein
MARVLLPFIAVLVLLPRTGRPDDHDPASSGEISLDEATCGVEEPCGPDEEALSVSEPTSSPAGEQGGACLQFWYGAGCPHCRRVLDHLEELRSQRYPSLEIRAHDAKQELDLYNGLLQEYEVPESMCGKVPVVFIGEHFCVGEKDCIEQLDSRIAACASVSCECVVPEGRSSWKVGLVGIASLAAVDAVNVCALAVLIILITSVLTRFPENRKRMLRIALMFIGGIFSAYFVVGLLIVLGLESISGLGSLSGSWVYRAVGGIAIVLGILNLKDFFWYGGGGFKIEVPESWRPRMKRIIESTISPAGAYAVGLIVSLFLLPCALGPYFVAGGLLTGMPFLHAIPWLLVYNVVFVLPMLVISLAVYSGFAAIKDIEDWRQRNMRKLHLVAGAILGVIGVLVVSGIL